MHYRPIAPRTQGFLFNNIEDWISSDNPVRLLDLLVDKLYEKDPSKFHGYKPAAKGPGGRPAYHPILFCKLYLYGYLNRINSSRRLEKECHRNMELIWLLSEEKPDFKTISNFRRDRGDLIRYCCGSFRRFLKEEGYITLEEVALDGCKIKANASKESYTLDWVVKRIHCLEGELDSYLSDLDKTDLEEEKEEQEVDRASLKDLDAVKKEIERLGRIKEEMERNSTKSHFPNDPDSRLMKGRYGSYPAYNVQGAVDQKNHMVVMAEVTNQPGDYHQLSDSVAHITEELEVSPDVLLADKGYANKEEIKAVETFTGTRCVIPLQESDQIKKDLRYNLIFTYDKDRDVILCPRAKELLLKNPNYVNRHGTRSRLYQAKRVICDKCPKKELCLNNKKGRTYHLSQDEFIRDYTFRSHTKEFRKEAGKRKSIIEHLFGTFRIWMGKNPLLLSGIRNVQTEIDLYATAYNFRRLLSLVPVHKLIEKLQKINIQESHEAFITTISLFRLFFRLSQSFFFQPNKKINISLA